MSHPIFIWQLAVKGTLNAPSLWHASAGNVKILAEWTTLVESMLSAQSTPTEQSATAFLSTRATLILSACHMSAWWTLIALLPRNVRGRSVLIPVTVQSMPHAKPSTTEEFAHVIPSTLEIHMELLAPQVMKYT